MPPFLDTITHRLSDRRTPIDQGRLSRAWSIGLVAAWLVVYPIGALLEPAPADPDAGSSLVISLVGTVLLAAWVTAAVGLARRQRYGATASLVAAVALTVAAIGCPASGHHHIGAWWYAQMTGALALVGLSAAATRTPAPDPSADRRR